MPQQRDLKDKHVLILGYGKSGKAAARLALEEGAWVTAVDERPLKNDRSDSHFSLIVFAPDIELQRTPDLIVLSPGVAPDSPMMRWTRQFEAEKLSELAFASSFAQAQMIAISGTNGKTTTVELLTHLLKHFGVKAQSCGNIGIAFSDAVCDARKSHFPDVWVCEISSFQLENAGEFYPESAALLNVSSDHMNRYGGMELYEHTKLKIFEHVTADRCVINQALLPHFQQHYPDAKAQTFSSVSMLSDWTFDEKRKEIYCRDGDLKLCYARMSATAFRGEHNAENIMAALALLRDYVPNLSERRDEVQAALQSFQIDGHRLEIVADTGVNVYINDSKGTNPDAVIAAVKLYGKIRNVRLVLGGLDKDMDFTLLRQCAAGVICAYIYGQAREHIYESIHDVIPCETDMLFDDAVQHALGDLDAHEVLMLSPACASMDQFKDYAERGERFRQLVQTHLLLHEEKN